MAVVSLVGAVQIPGAAAIDVAGASWSSLGAVLSTSAGAEGLTLKNADTPFERSDAYPFAARGVPAVEISTGLTLELVRTLVRFGSLISGNVQIPKWNTSSPFAGAVEAAGSKKK